MVRLSAIAELPDDWDGEGSPGTDPCLIRSALELLARLQAVSDTAVPVPDVCPIAGGGFQLEWECGRRALELEFVNGDTMAFLTAEDHPEGEVVTSGEYPTRLFGQTRELVEWMVGG